VEAGSDGPHENEEYMLRRKITDRLAEWKGRKSKNPILIKGVRQCGKTSIVQKFAEENYEHVVYPNFVRQPRLPAAFESPSDVDDIIMSLSAMVRGAVFGKGKTCLISRQR